MTTTLTPLVTHPILPGGYHAIQEIHRIPGTREHCYTPLALDLDSMTAVCPQCGAGVPKVTAG